VPPFVAIVLASLAGGVLSVAIAAGTLTLHPRWIPHLVAFAVGALLGAVFLELLPHALEIADTESVMITVLAGLLLFFLLEKLVLWRHSHGHEDEEVAELREHHDHGRPGLMILVGATIHNFCDGIVIAVAFLADPTLGIATALAIVAHAIPQQVGDFAVLLHSGYGRRNALVANLGTGLATLAGAMLAYFALSDMQRALPITLGFAAASLLYVAVADLIPGLHKRPEPKATVQQLALIGSGLGVIAVVHALLAH
jgi:zinc and cadmium transporter